MVQRPSQPLMAEQPPDSANTAPVWQPETPNWDMLGEEWLSDEPELESDFHRDQIDLLLHLLKWHWRHRNDIYCSGNTTVYYDESQRTTRNFRGPDVFVVLGANPKPRNSWMVWREGGQYPHVVIELLSDSTAKTDRTTKKDLYAVTWRLPNYFWFHPRTKEFQGFRLADNQYEPILPNPAGYLWSDQLELFLGLHEGMLRLFTDTGELVLSQAEAETLRREQTQQQLELEQQRAQTVQQQLELEQQRAQTVQQQLELEQQRAQTAQQRVEQLARRLQELGVDPHDLA
jgi:Uma2 family endonuclease